MTSLAGVEPYDHLDALVRVAQIPESDQVLVAGSRPGDPLARPTNQEDTVTPYTDTDVDLVADAIADARIQGFPFSCDAMARAVLDALASAGRLLPTEPRRAA